jgi:hypothetical protein
MLKAFFYSDSSCEWLFKWIQAKTERRISVNDIIEELSALFYFKIICSIQSSFVYCASYIILFSFTFSAWYKYIQSENIMNCKLLRVDFLLKCLSIIYYLISINQMLLQFVRKYTLQGCHIIGVSNFLNNISDFIVEFSWFYQSNSGLCSFIGSKDDISFFSCYNSIFIWIDDNSVGDKWSESINMYSKLYLYEISFFNICWVFGERCIVSTYFVDRNSSWKGNPLKGWFFVINFRELFIYLAIWPET